MLLSTAQFRRNMKCLLTSSTLQKTARNIADQRRLAPSPIARVQTKQDKCAGPTRTVLFVSNSCEKLQVDNSCFPLEYEEEKENILLEDAASALHGANVKKPDEIMVRKL